MQISGFELLLPEGVLDYFEILKVDQSKTETSIFLQEKNIIPEEYIIISIYPSIATFDRLIRC